jgi:L-threonylcarbamoyladenylate synthase
LEVKLDTKVCYLTKDSSEEIKEAGMLIKNGGTVVFPTETVYGLGANALDPIACLKIFEAKGRPQDNPLIIHVADFDISRFVKHIPMAAEKLMESFWPGPLTIIMKKSDLIPDMVSAKLDSVAIRMPENKIARMLIEYAGVPIAAPSANISGKPSPTSIEHCIEDLTGKVDMIIGGEKCKIGLESTVVDATGNVITILRPGCITKHMLEEVVGYVEIDPAISGKLEDGIVVKSPGMKYRHYAPKAPLTIVTGNCKDVIRYINKKIHELQSQGYETGILGTDENIKEYEGNNRISLGSRSKNGIIAANLFDCLREFDKIDIDYIFAEGFSEEGIGLAIMNRLKKAASYNIIDLNLTHE